MFCSGVIVCILAISFNAVTEGTDPPECKMEDLTPCGEKMKAVTDGMGEMRNPATLELKSDNVEKVCKNYGEFDACLKKLKCKLTMKDMMFASILTLEGFLKTVCTETNKKVIADKDNQKCMTSNDVKKAVGDCGKSINPTSGKPPTCKDMNEYVRCHHKAMASCGKAVDKMDVQIFSSLIDMTSKMAHASPAKTPLCDIEPDLKALAADPPASGASRTAIPVTFFALLATNVVAHLGKF